MATGAPTSRRDDPAVRANVRRTAWILASIAVVFFLGLFASRLIGDTSLAMTAIGAAELCARTMRGERSELAELVRPDRIYPERLIDPVV